MINERNYAIDMLDETESFVAVYHTFLQRVSTHRFDENNIIPCFFEGKDELTYYPTRIESMMKNKKISNKDTDFIDCNGRENVIKLYFKLLLDSHPLSKNSLFFIDKDFYYENELPEKIYVTPHNTIENFFAPIDVLINFLNAHSNIPKYGVDEDHEANEYLRGKYYNELLEELKLNAPLSAWYSLQMNLKSSKDCPDLTGLQTLNKVKNKLSAKKSEKISLDFLISCTPNMIPVTKKQFEDELKKISSDLISNSRGKFVEEIILKIYNDILSEIDSNSNEKIKKVKMKFEPVFYKKNIKNVLGEYALTPPCLITYLDKHIF